jgi:serine-type D-Ala-D-Ala carboxypeptidase (penicillin-binding protein 5/6)
VRGPGRSAPAALVVVVLALVVVLAGPAGALAAPPAVRAPSAILVEPATGDVVFARAPEVQRPIASTTKLMTALLALERLRLSDRVSATAYRASPVESVIGLRTGERLSVADLLRGMLLASANDAAATLAARVGGTQTRFVALMNRRARRLGLNDTHYANPIGLDAPGAHSSAEDLVKLTLILRRNRFFRTVTDLPRATLRTGSRPRTVVNRNDLVRNVPFVDGVKTGHTLQAGYVLVGSASRRGVTVLSAVLGDPSIATRDADSLALLRFGLRRYHRVTAVRRGVTYATADLAHRDGTVALVATRRVRATTRRGERLVRRVVGAPREVDGPLPARARLATLEVRWRSRTVARVPLVTRAAVARATVVDRAGGILSRTLVVAAAAIVAVLMLQVVLLRRRALRRRRRAGRSRVA